MMEIRVQKGSEFSVLIPCSCKISVHQLQSHNFLLFTYYPTVQELFSFFILTFGLKSSTGYLPDPRLCSTEIPWKQDFPSLGGAVHKKLKAISTELHRMT